MGESPTGRVPGVTLRAPSSLVVGIALLALAGVLLADAALRGRWDVVAFSSPALGLVVWVAVEVFLRPGIRLNSAGITVVNPLWTTEVPWGAVTDVTTRFVVAVETTDGRRVRSWGAPTAARTRPAGARPAGARPSGTSGWLRASPPHLVIESYLVQYGDRPVPAHAAGPFANRRFHVTTAVVAGALLIIAVSQALAGS
ncbi:PH domain-containing protein [Cryobacterium sp.]|jgi:hypothetical protein|uniref:PH domain-containing protein n=1 Tax=Cryobacterium sp. TaxID=1926290 RepID=UPI00261521FB|nr:PH domain-containing protein [Cryobacterium sp.]MCU1447807.1 hypothetical protein [Cryobacterium sp.]